MDCKTFTGKSVFKFKLFKIIIVILIFINTVPIIFIINL